MSKTVKISGVVGVSDLEGGYFTFSDGKTTYKLEGGGHDLLKRRVRAEVEGVIDDDVMGIGFGAPVLRVRKYRLR